MGALARISYSFVIFLFVSGVSATDLDSLQAAFETVYGFEPWQLCGDCDSIRSINLTSRNLSGTLNWKRLAELDHLQILDLSNNSLAGHIQEILWTMPNLRFLNLASNQFGGVLNFDWSRSDRSNFSNLEYINLSSNRLHASNSPLDLSGFTNLRIVDLSHNKLADNKVLAQLISLSTICNISMAGSSLGSIPRPWALQIFPNLNYLDLSNSNLTGGVLALSVFSSLQYLDLSNNTLTGKFPSDLPYLQNLRFLNLAGNNLTGTLLSNDIQKFGAAAFLRSGVCNSTLHVPCEYHRPPLNTSSDTSSGEPPFKIPSILTPPLLSTSPSSGNLSIGAVAAISTAAALVALFAAATAVFILRQRQARRRNTMKDWIVPRSDYPYCLEQTESGPFSFETDSGIEWVADIKDSTSAPVVLFEKPLLSLTFADLLGLTSHFSKESQLAEGPHGPVYRAILPGDVHVAIKVLDQAKDVDVEYATSKLHTLGRLKHPNILPLVGYCIAGKEKLLIYEFMHNGDLHQWLHELPGIQHPEELAGDPWDEPTAVEDEPRMGWGTRHKIALGVARALAFLHHGCFPAVAHGGLQSANVLLDDRFEPRLAEAGIQDLIDPIGPLHASSSEDNSDAKADVYSFGLVLLELVTGRMADGGQLPDGFGGDLVEWVRFLIKEKRGDSALDSRLVNIVPVNVMLETLRIGYLCTAENPFKRPSMQQVVGLLKDIQSDRALN